MKQNFKIADIYFCIQSNIELPWDSYLTSFFTKNMSIGCKPICYELQIVDKLPEPEGHLTYNAQDQKIFEHEHGEDRLHYFWLHTEPHMLYHEQKDKTIVYYYKKYQHALEHQYLIFNAIAPEKLFLKHNAMILHSSFIIKDGKAIVFSAPSGTGKSTQAALWETYGGAEIINGDRCLIQKRENGWYASGLPICGSSDICKNKEAPIQAVIYLSQAPENDINVISPAHAARKLISETTINFWNQAFLDHAINLWSEFVKDIPVYHYACTKEPDTVTFLKKELRSRE